jgi:hypothetical protein
MAISKCPDPVFQKDAPDRSKVASKLGAEKNAVINSEQL